MKFIAIIIVYFTGIAGLYAQAAGKQSVAFSNEIKTEDLVKNLNLIAGAAMEGRETGTPGQARAAAFIADYYKSIGLAPGNNGSYFQYYTVIKDSMTEIMLQINGQQFRYGADYTFPASINANGTISAAGLSLEVVWGGYGITDPVYDNLAGMDLQGKALLVLSGEPKMRDSPYRTAQNQQGDKSKTPEEADNNYLLTHTNRPSGWSGFTVGTQRKAQAAARSGAKVLFVIDTNHSWQKKYSFPIRLPQAAKDSIPINVYIISEAIAKAIVGRSYDRLIGQAGQVKPAGFHTAIALDAAQQVIHRTIQASNVMAYLPGTDKKEELLIVSAHYDHLGVRDGKIFYGADDNGSGTTAVLEMAKAFAKASAGGKGPRRSLLFLNVSGEEEQLWGADYYITHPVYPLAHTVADLNTDMIGRTDPAHRQDSNYIYIIGDDKLSSALRLVNVANNNAYTKLHLDYKYNDPDDKERIYYRSDHYNFAKNKIPVIFFFDGINTDYHQPSDTPDKIDYNLMTRRTKLIFHDAWSIANREEKLPVDRNEK